MLMRTSALSSWPAYPLESYGAALVVSNDLFNRHTGLAIVCPITYTDREFPFHVAIPPEAKQPTEVPPGESGVLPVSEVVMVDQVKSVDFRSREAKRIGKASPRLLNEVLAILDACIY